MSNRKSKTEKEREKIVQDRLQKLLTRMLQDDDNKYCVDCDSKGPRWASWNLGIFMCIRCAGIHRNLGVHISKVKSVNLDSWTPHQVASMQLIGNSRGRAIYEAQVSEDFRRPQTDSQLEVFIRAKYEKKKYIAREWVPTKAPEYPLGWNELIEAEKLKKDPRSVIISSPPSKITMSKSASSSTTTVRPATTTTFATVTIPSKNKDLKTVEAQSLSSDLLGLTISGNVSANLKSQPSAIPAAPQIAKSNYSNDLLGLSGGPTSQSTDFDFLGMGNTRSGQNNNNATCTASHTCKSESNLFDLDSNSGFANFQTVKSESENGSSKMSKDSIMALFNQPQQQQPQQQQPQQQQPQQQQQQLPAFMTEYSSGPKPNPFNNYGEQPAMPLGSNFVLHNNAFSNSNPFLVAASAVPIAHTTQTLDLSQISPFAGINSRHFIQ